MPKKPIYVISGLSGWLGRSLAFELIEKYQIQPTQILGIGSRNRIVEIFNGCKLQILNWEESFSLDQVEIFAHYGFLTRDKIENLDSDEYIRKNSTIIESAARFIQATAPKHVLNISSGAVYKSPDFESLDHNLDSNPYGYLKLLEERALADICKSTGTNLVINRLFGLTGRDIQNTAPYAMAEFIKLALIDEPIHIRSKNFVFRRFVNAGDLNQLLINMVKDEQNKTFDSGGPKIEVRDLAKLVVKLLNSQSMVLHSEDSTCPIDSYFSKSSEYENLFLANVDSELKSLEEQILETAEGIQRLR